MPLNQSFPPPPGSFGWVQAILAQRGKLAPEDITLLIKRNLSSDQIEAVVAALRPKGKSGRPSTHSLAQLDFDPDFQAMLAEPRKTEGAH